jgi:MYXO-CTERM domain-containing protein
MLAALATAAYAFTVQTVPGTDQPVFWGAMPLDYTFVDDTRLPPGGSSAVARAFEAWSHVEGTRAAFAPQAALDAAPVVANDDHHVVFLAQEWPYGNDALAIASVWSNDTTGELVHFDIRVNPTVDWAIDGDADCFDLESAVTHEVGHVLGLEHSELDEATMFAVLSPGHVRQGLHEDDEEGLRFLYPDDEQAPRASCSTIPGPSGALGLAIAIVALGRRRRGEP